MPTTPDAPVPERIGRTPAANAAAGVVGPWQARIAGALAAVVALAAGEMLSALGGSDQSLIASVGNSFVNQFAASLKDIAVKLFGTSDKAALVIGIVFISVLIGAALGTATTRRPWVGPVGFGLFGLFGLYAGLTDPLTNKAVVVVAAAGATAAGIATLWMLLRVAATGALRSGGVDHAGGASGAEPDLTASRRVFFGWAAAAGVFAIGISAAGRLIAGSSKAEEVRDATKLRPPTNAGTLPITKDNPFGLEDLTPYYISNEGFYRIDTAIVVPQVDPTDWKLKINGMVDHPFELSYDELLKMDQVEEAVTLSCVSNEVGGNLVGNAVFQGVPLKAILDRAGVQAGATQIVGTSVDGFTAGFPTETGLDGRVAMVALGMNGEPLPIPHGFPARLVIAGLYGYVSATKWLSEIRLTTWEAFDGYWIPRGWSKLGPIKTECRIDVPTQGATLTAGPTKVAGVAWAPSIGIQKVEVQIDDGPWQTARLAEVVSKNTWVQWVADWDAPSGRHTIRARATDNTGTTQTSAIASPAPDGASGYPALNIKVDG